MNIYLLTELVAYMNINRVAAHFFFITWTKS